jgi:pimeloyl-ACP methyl ester carboxylesterase
MNRNLRTSARLAEPVVLLALPLLVGACTAAESNQQQTPAREASSEAAVYVPMVDLPPGNPGDVISYRQTSLPFVSDAKAWLIQYRSTDALDKPIAVSGTVIVPNATWTGTGRRPIVAFAPETLGITDNCAASKQLSSGLYMEKGYLDQVLAKNWALAITDYEGLGMPGNHTYVIAPSEAHTVLDSVRAATRTPGSGLDISAPVGIWGYSQGGGSAAAAAERAPTYAPELHVVGAAAGGVPADLVAVSANLEGSLFYGFQAAASIGLDTAYPELQLDQYLNDTGKRQFGALEAGTQSGCLIDLIVGYAFGSTSLYTTMNPMTLPNWQKRLEENKLGKIKPLVPTFVYHGDVDEIIPNAVGVGLRDRWCALGATVKWAQYPFGEHLVAQALASGDVVNWLDDRFNGRPAPSTCSP